MTTRNQRKLARALKWYPWFMAWMFILAMGSFVVIAITPLVGGDLDIVGPLTILGLVLFVGLPGIGFVIWTEMTR